MLSPQLINGDKLRQLPSLSDSYVPSLSDRYVPSLSDRYVPSLSDSYVPSLSDSYVPSLSDRYVPSLSDTTGWCVGASIKCSPTTVTLMEQHCRMIADLVCCGFQYNNTSRDTEWHLAIYGHTLIFQRSRTYVSMSTSTCAYAHYERVPMFTNIPILMASVCSQLKVGPRVWNLLNTRVQTLVSYLLPSPPSPFQTHTLNHQYTELIMYVVISVATCGCHLYRCSLSMEGMWCNIHTWKCWHWLYMRSFIAELPLPLHLLHHPYNTSLVFLSKAVTLLLWQHITLCPMSAFTGLPTHIYT